MKKKRTILFLIFITICVLNIKSQPYVTLSGRLKNEKSNLGVAFATIMVLDTKDSSMLKGTTSNLNGDFSINSLHKGTYLLKVQHMSHKTLTKEIIAEANETINLGTIPLAESAIKMNEVVVIGKRIRAKEEGGKTIFFMNKQLEKASHTGYDVLRQIPGVQEDIFKNISYNGNENVKIYINGVERDIEYLGQLNASDMKKIEVISSPGSQYQSNTGAVINIVMKENKESFKGYIYSEIPTSKSTVYLFPSYGFNYNYEKVNLHTSYNGEISNFDIIKKRVYSFENEVRNKTSSYHSMRQKNWSHRFNFDVDYKINKKNLLNFYGFYNPFSQEHDGIVKATTAHDNNEQNGWNAKKEDTDKNNVIYGSLFYKHLLKKGGHIGFKLETYNLNAKNRTNYKINKHQKTFPEELTGATSHLQKKETIKIDYKSPEIFNKIKLNAGVINVNESINNQSNSLNHKNNMLAIYGITHYRLKNLNLELGYRIEKTISNIKNESHIGDLDFLPAANMIYKFAKNQNIKLSYKHYYNRPTVFQLNPGSTIYGSFKRQYGNTDLKNEMYRKCYLDHSISREGDYFSYRIFYESIFNAINYVTYSNDMNILESVYINSGKVDCYGLQLNGSFKLSRSITMANFFKLGNYRISPNNDAKLYGSINKTKLVYESGLSAIIAFQRDITASLNVQYNSPKPMLQGSTYSDPLYFLSFEKKFKKHIKAGVTIANPFMKSITYYGNKEQGRQFSSNNQEMISTTGFPIWFKISYSFTKGKKKAFSKPKQVDIEKGSKKGF